MITTLAHRLLFIFAACLCAAARAEAPPAADVELYYAEGLLAYHRREYSDALRLADAALRLVPNGVKALELRALSLRGLRDYPRSLAAYEQLRGLAVNRPERAAVYVFSIGLLQLLLKDYTAARESLEKALAMNFYPPACHYFLGVLQLKDRAGDWGEAHLEAVTRAESPELVPAGDLQLAHVAAAWRDGYGGVRRLTSARDGAREQLAAPPTDVAAPELARGVLAIADRALAAVGRPRFSGSASLISAYDSNLLYLPTNAASGLSSFEELLQVGLGYQSSATARAQFVASYRATANYDFNPATRDGQFVLQGLSLFLNVDPAGAVRYGLKLEGAYSLQHAESSGGGTAYRPFTLIGSVGPYVRVALGSKWTLGAELFAEPQKFYLDSQLAPDFRLSGTAERLRLFVRGERHDRFWNPEIALVQIYQRTDGAEYRDFAIAIEAVDRFRFDFFLGGRIGVSVGSAVYASRPAGRRNDTPLAFEVGLARRFGGSLEATLDVRLVDNLSNVYDYHYRRAIASLGLTYVF